MKAKNIFISLFCLWMFSARTVQASHSNEHKETVKAESVFSTQDEHQKEFIEFKFKDIELQEISKWKERSVEEMWKDAFECDRAALYMLGMGFITGSMGLTIDVEKADFYFSRSASFGFAPSIKQLIHKNIEDENKSMIAKQSK